MAGLNLTRAINETVIITPPGGEPITVTLLEIRGGSEVKLNITADRSVKILRAEVPDDGSHKCKRRT